MNLAKLGYMNLGMDKSSATREYYAESEGECIEDEKSISYISIFNLIYNNLF